MASLDDKEPVLESSTADDHDDSKPSPDEEDTGAEIAPIIKLDAVAVTTGEEHEDPLIDLKAKLYRFDKEGNQWKERGVGQVRLLKHKETGRIRLVMRQNKTLKICANHAVVPTVNLQEHQGSDKTWVWHASDFSDGELKDELFCIRFGSVENARAFKTAYEEAQKAVLVKSKANEESADSVGELLKELKVEEKTKEEKPEEEKKEDKAEEPHPVDVKEGAATEEQ